MHLSKITIENFRCFGEGGKRFELPLKKGLIALVGENEAGKTAVIDALRFALGTTDQEWYRLEDTDFHRTSREISIVCKFEGLSTGDKRAFVEYLTYGEKTGDEPVLYINWTAKNTGETYRGRPYRPVEVYSGRKGDGPSLDPGVRDRLLRATYLRPLRDADQSLSAGRGSRLAQVLRHSNLINTGIDAHDPARPLNQQQLSVLGIGNLINELLKDQEGVQDAREEIDKKLKELSLLGDRLKSEIKVSGVTAAADTRLRELLEKLDLRLDGEGKLGLGSDNLLFMACELLLLVQETEGNKLLLIEEPEAHLHPQRQLRVMKYLQEQAKEQGIQIIVTTHSPNLASAIELDNMVIIHNRFAYSLANGKTELEPSDYRFLERFLDVTKANLFFARGLMIVEGDAENILLPTIARLLGRPFTDHGVSIVNVGGTGLRRYARIFQRKDVKDEEKEKQVAIPIACLADMDVMPDCAPTIIGKVKEGDKWPPQNKRRWRAKGDFGTLAALIAERERKIAKASGQSVNTFVSDEWTLEYDLALGPKGKEGNFPGGLAEDVFVAASLADEDDAINAKTKTVADVEKAAREEFAHLMATIVAKDACTTEEVLASHVYAKFTHDGVSKPVAAQYLAEQLQQKLEEGRLTVEDLRKRLPEYLTGAIDYVTSGQKPYLTQEKVDDEKRPSIQTS